jgi:hypothetical protein
MYKAIAEVMINTHTIIFKIFGKRFSFLSNAYFLSLIRNISVFFIKLIETSFQSLQGLSDHVTPTDKPVRGRINHIHSIEAEYQCIDESCKINSARMIQN